MKRILCASTCLLVFIPAFASRPLLARKRERTRIQASAIQVEMIQSDEINCPPISKSHSTKTSSTSLKNMENFSESIATAIAMPAKP